MSVFVRQYCYCREFFLGHRDRHEYICPKCGFCTNDDRAATINIRERGMDKLNTLSIPAS